MTREQTKSLMPVLVAWSEGRDIQCRSSCRDCEKGPWVDCPSHEFLHFEDRLAEWRVKPTPREFYLTGTHAFDSPQMAQAMYPNQPIIHVREVVE